MSNTSRPTFPTDDFRSGARSHERGSALLLAVFVLVVLSSLGIALLFLTQMEVRMSKASVQTKKVFSLAEAGQEDGRATLYAIKVKKDEVFSEELKTAAGPDGLFQIDPAKIEAVYDSDGNLTGFTGYGDDEPLTPMTRFGEGYYAVFLSQDPIERDTPTIDSNRRVTLTGVGVGPDQTFEVVEAIVESEDIFMNIPPATITLLGPDPTFMGGNSNAKEYSGNDCGGGARGVPGLHVPTVGTVDTTIDEGMIREHLYEAGGYTGYDTAADLSDEDALDAMGAGLEPIDPSWSDCGYLQRMIDKVRLSADVICEPPAECTLPPATPDRIVFVDGDFDLGPNTRGEGLVFVTGELRMHGSADWNGIVMAIGEGRFERYGAGNGRISGAVIVADIAGPDETYGTDDECAGGLGPVSYEVNGGGTGDTEFCLADITPAVPIPPYSIVSFRQH